MTAQAIAETGFDILYLGFALFSGLTMAAKGRSPAANAARKYPMSRIFSF